MLGIARDIFSLFVHDGLSKSGIARRLKSIDDGYFIFLNYRTGKLEVHNDKNGANTLCLVLPYDALDERTVRRVRETRIERARELIAELERSQRRAV